MVAVVCLSRPNRESRSENDGFDLGSDYCKGECSVLSSTLSTLVLHLRDSIVRIPLHFYSGLRHNLDWNGRELAPWSFIDALFLQDQNSEFFPRAPYA